MSQSTITNQSTFQGLWTNTIIEVIPKGNDEWAESLSLHMEAHFPSKNGQAIQHFLKNVLRELSTNWETLRESNVKLLAKPTSCGGIIPMNPPIERKKSNNYSSTVSIEDTCYIPEDPWWRNC
tara:strand:+ start:213 stop:581 length:369 start_codon:yes stop_codon:yes gene_type:complete